ncbi:MAG: hypothetical protein AB7O66_13370 [Limisphaerales bacterium]
MDCLKNITAADVVRAIQSASKRIVFLAPGIDEATAAALGTAWQHLGPEAVTVILDIDAEVVRLGYGTQKGLEDIQVAAAACNQAVCHQPGVRICVVVADETSLIFTPTPLLIEAGSIQPNRPNGIALQATPKALGDELGVGGDGPAKRQIGLEVVRIEAIEAVKKDLTDNPPLKFDLSRKERVFNAKLEFVEFELEGCFISRHTVTIPPELVGMAKMDQKTRDKLRSSFRLLEESDILDAKKKISEKTLRDECQRIRRKFLRSVTGYGALMLRANKDTFEKEVGALREQVKAFQNALREKLTGIYDDNAKRLTKALLPSVLKSPPEEWTGALGTNPEKKEMERMLHRTLLQAFGDPESLLKEMRVNLNFKGVTYGTLIDAKFIKGASDQFPNLKLHEEYQAARGSAAPTPLQHETEPS